MFDPLGGAAPGGSLGFTPTAGQAAAGCNLLPAGPIRDACLLAGSFLPGGQTPVEAAVAIALPSRGGTALATSPMVQPTLTQRLVHECPRFVNGKGILWMDFSGNVVCLPRGHNGRDIGLIRKNPKRKKAFITAAEKNALTKVDKTRKKAKVFAKLAGLHTHTAHRGR